MWLKDMLEDIKQNVAKQETESEDSGHVATAVINKDKMTRLSLPLPILKTEPRRPRDDHGNIKLQLSNLTEPNVTTIFGTVSLRKTATEGRLLR